MNSMACIPTYQRHLNMTAYLSHIERNAGCYKDVNVLDIWGCTPSYVKHSEDK